MNYYVAPMDGITNFVWRKVHRQCFPGATLYYAPFMVATSDHNFQPKELKDVQQGEKDIVPQILTNRAEYFIWAARELFSMGFDQVNLNMGCPSGTVVAKHKGSGMLSDVSEMDQILDTIFNSLQNQKISIKARIGKDSVQEWEAIYKVFNRYPIYELTVHPRIQKEGYRGQAHRDIFQAIHSMYRGKLVYNGDLYTVRESIQILESYNDLSGLMFGRGLITDPSLIRQLQGGEKATREELTGYHQMLVEEYQKLYAWDNATICHMKEFWSYFRGSFENTDKQIKALLKTKRMDEYLSCAATILNTCKIKETE